MNKKVKDKLIAIFGVLVIVVSSITVFVTFDKIKNIFSEPEKQVTPQVDSSEEKELDQTTKNVMKMLNQLDEEMITGYIEKLTSFGPHPTAHRIISRLCPWDLPIEKVREYLFDEFQSIGLEVKLQPWEQKATLKNLRVPNYFFGWFEGKNVVATLPGTDKNSDEIHVLVAHYDTWPRAPGADDDGSGVACILSAAKLMSQYSFNDTVHFVLVDGEEQGFFGSHQYVQEALKNNDNIVSSICIDMIGSKTSDYRREKSEVLIVTDENSQWMTDFTNNVNIRYSDSLNFTIYQDDPEGHASDYKEFIAFGLYANYYSESEFNEYWHTPRDTIENMDITKATKTSKLILATVAELAWNVVYE